jgi:hypothetical protein
MKFLKKIALTALFLGTVSFSAQAQKKIVHGKVTAFGNIPVQLADVTIKKSKITVYTDSVGGFQIEAKTKDKISVKVDGFKGSTVKVKNLSDSIHIKLMFDGEEEDIILAANKGHLHKINLPKAIEYFNTPKPYSFGYSTIENLITGKFPNVNLRDGVIKVRGGTSIQSGVNSEGAMIVINGVQSDWSTLKGIVLTSIKKMEILTGATAARYGSGGSNGVLYVQTISN